MKDWLLIGAIGFGVYWWFWLRQKPATTLEAAAEAGIVAKTQGIEAEVAALIAQDSGVS